MMEEHPESGVAWESLTYLFRSHHRYEILRELPTTFTEERAFAESVSCSRATVHRCLTEFVEFGWVQNDRTRFRRTEAGEQVCDRVSTLLSSTSTATRFMPLVELAAEYGVELELTTIDDATVSISSATSPNKAARTYYDRLTGREFGSVRAYFGAVTERVRDRLTQFDSTADIAVTVRDPATGEAADRREAIRSGIDAEWVTWADSDDVDYSTDIVVFDERTAVVAVRDDENRITASLSSDGGKLVRACSAVVSALRMEADRPTRS